MWPENSQNAKRKIYFIVSIIHEWTSINYLHCIELWSIHMERFLSDGLERIIGKKSWENEKKALLPVDCALYKYYILINRAGGLYGGIFCQRSFYSSVQRQRAVQADQALLISILLNGYIYNGNKNDKNTHNMQRFANWFRCKIKL